MPQRKKDKYLYKSILADYIVNGEYELSEPHDFNRWVELIENGEATERHMEEKHLRYMIRFIDKVSSGEQPEKMIMEYFAGAFYGVIGGNRWEDEILLPWTEVSVGYSRAELIDLELHGEVESILEGSPDEGVITAIQKAADKFFTSYEKARAAYYKYKR